MGNHTHMVLRSRPDIARKWSAQEVALRWLTLTPKMDKAGNVIEPKPEQIQAIADDPEQVEKLRLQLSDISWWMRSYSQHIATRANREDGESGHFWEGRFKAHVLVDEVAILRCLLYVDLNPIRAGLAHSIEDSDFTGAKDRFDDLRVHVATTDDQRICLQFSSTSETAQWERLEHSHSGWLSPIELDAQLSAAADETDGTEPWVPGQLPSRVSQRGALRISLSKYLLLLDLLGRQPRTGGSGTIPPEMVPILELLNLDPTDFMESIWYFGRRFKSSVGRRPKETDLGATPDGQSMVAV
jgi:REP element-mobilizing transposase RayT